MSAYIVDTETTGQEPVGEVIELAFGRVSTDFKDFMLCTEARFEPKGRITFSAMAVHHILPDELKGFDRSENIKLYLPDDMEYMIGHNVDYDWEHIGRPACRRICTLAISRYIWPGNDGHGLSCLAYHLAQPEKYQDVRDFLRGAHGAKTDVYLCFGVLQAMLQQPQLQGISSFEALWQFSENARIPRIWTFGKHKGEEIARTDHGYLGWCSRQPDMDPYVKEAVRLALRGELTP